MVGGDLKGARLFLLAASNPWTLEEGEQTYVWVLHSSCHSVQMQGGGKKQTCWFCMAVAAQCRWLEGGANICVGFAWQLPPSADGWRGEQTYVWVLHGSCRPVQMAGEGKKQMCGFCMAVAAQCRWLEGGRNICVGFAWQLPPSADGWRGEETYVWVLHGSCRPVQMAGGGKKHMCGFCMAVAAQCRWLEGGRNICVGFAWQLLHNGWRGQTNVLVGCTVQMAGGGGPTNVLILPSNCHPVHKGGQASGQTSGREVTQGGLMMINQCVDLDGSNSRGYNQMWGVRQLVIAATVV